MYNLSDDVKIPEDLVGDLLMRSFMFLSCNEAQPLSVLSVDGGGRSSAPLLIVLSLLVGQSRVHLAVRDGHAHIAGGANETAHWRGHGMRGERSRVGGSESENAEQPLECQRCKLAASCYFPKTLFSQLLSLLTLLGSPR